MHSICDVRASVGALDRDSKTSFQNAIRPARYTEPAADTRSLRARIGDYDPEVRYSARGHCCASQRSRLDS